MTEQYETLRAAAVGDRLPLEVRSGLALLLRRGMWAWARAAAAAASATPKPTRSFLANSTATNDEQRAVVRLFAALAMKPNNKRDYP